MLMFIIHLRVASLEFLQVFENNALFYQQVFQKYLSILQCLGECSILFIYEHGCSFGQGKVTHEIPLEPANHRTGHVWHAFLKGGFQDMVYGFKFDGKFSPEDGHYYDRSCIVLDPYAKVSVSYEPTLKYFYSTNRC